MHRPRRCDVMCNGSIASVNIKRDWLICAHVTSDKCDVSRRATGEKLLPAPTATYINKQNGGTTSIIRNYDFPSFCSNKECKREEKCTTGNRICFVGSFNFKLVYTIEFLSRNTIVICMNIVEC